MAPSYYIIAGDLRRSDQRMGVTPHTARVLGRRTPYIARDLRAGTIHLRERAWHYTELEA